ncbi:MAG: 2-oxopent-4-enoate hydratase [Acidobacteriota bacterium]|nr:2-oxopent-4-enoate hydratase [Acidobacteriota bacterium]
MSLIDQTTADRLAAELATSERECRPITLLTQRFPDMTRADARAVARARDRLRVAEGDRRIGYKLGWTSAAMRRSLGISRPNWGTLWESQVLSSGQMLDVGMLRHPKVEPEIVYRVGADLDGLGATVTTGMVEEACGGWAVGLEVVDPRFPDYRFDWLDNTADNSSASRVVQSTWVAGPSDTAAWTVEFSDGEATMDGLGAAAMGSPVNAVMWLVEALAEEGERLRAGDIVFTGGITPPLDVSAGRSYRASAPRTGLAVSFDASHP